jgi:hypothetical protein
MVNEGIAMSGNPSPVEPPRGFIDLVDTGAACLRLGESDRIPA